LIGQEYRFLETEVFKWLESYKPSQERLEREFRDKQGRTIKEYVTGEIALATLRISYVNLRSLCKKGMPYVTVGEKDFFHIQDILNYFRKGDPVTNKTNESIVKINSHKEKNAVAKTSPSINGNLIMSINKEFLLNLETNNPIFIVDGSYNFENNTVGTGMVVVENGTIATGYSNVRNVKTTKTTICEYLALLDALRMIKGKNIKQASIITDQEPFTKGIHIDLKKSVFEPVVQPYMKEIKDLLGKLEGKVDLRFVGILKGGKKNPLHKNAHFLSREYKKEIVENMEIS
jgi:ribonuclease HI